MAPTPTHPTYDPSSGGPSPPPPVLRRLAGKIDFDLDPMIRSVPTLAVFVLASLTCAHALGCKSNAGSPGTPEASGLRSRNVPAHAHVPLQGNEPQRGPDDALVTIVEFSDFECPYCARVVITLKQLMQGYGNDVRIVWMNYPLPFHKNARRAATAGLEAHAQKGNEAFWALHDKMFANQSALAGASLEKMAEEVGLDLDTIREALASDKYDATIDAHESLAYDLGVRGTPAFFINGRFFRGAQPLTRFATIVNEELDHAKALVARGTPKLEVYETTIASGITKVEIEPPKAAPVPGAAPAPSPRHRIPWQRSGDSSGPKPAAPPRSGRSPVWCPSRAL